MSDVTAGGIKRSKVAPKLKCRHTARAAAFVAKVHSSVRDPTRLCGTLSFILHCQTKQHSAKQSKHKL